MCPDKLVEQIIRSDRSPAERLGSVVVARMQEAVRQTAQNLGGRVIGFVRTNSPNPHMPLEHNSFRLEPISVANMIASVASMKVYVPRIDTVTYGTTYLTDPLGFSTRLARGVVGPYYLLEDGEIEEVRQQGVNPNPAVGENSKEIINSLIDITATYALATQSPIEDK